MTVCACHGEPKTADGKCRVLKRGRDSRYLLADKGRARQRKFRLREYLARTSQQTKELTHTSLH